MDIAFTSGERICDVVPHPEAPDLPVVGSVAELLETSGAPDVVVLSATLPPAQEVDIALTLIRAKARVLTLNSVRLDFDAQRQLHEAAKAEGVAMLATGIEDFLYVHLPAVAAASNHALTRVVFDDVADASTFSGRSGLQDAGMGLDAEEFEVWRREAEAYPIQGGGMRELAQRLGLTPGPVSHTIEPVLLPEPAAWPGAGSGSKTGSTIGSRAESRMVTAEGVTFEASLVFKILQEGEVSGHFYRFEGAQTLAMSVTRLDQHLTTDTALVARVPDVLNAAPGYWRAGSLGPQRYVHPTGSPSTGSPDASGSA